MKVLLTGAAGFIGERLARAILDRGALEVDGAQQPVTELVLFDRVAGRLTHPRARWRVGDLTDPTAVREAVAGAGAIFHLAAVPSAQAEADVELGYRVNLDGTRLVLEAARRAGGAPRFVFTSSVAVYGPPLPEPVTEATPPRPQLSYGAQKLAAEILVHDYSRRGVVDGRSVRLPAILVRLGPPNAAASGWASSLVRELLAGRDAVCPVRPEARLACLSVAGAVDALLRIHAAPAAALPERRVVLLPGIAVSAAGLVAALRRRAGLRPLGTVRWVVDEAVQRIADGAPAATVSADAARLGIVADADVDEIVRRALADALATEPAAAGG